MRLYLDIRTTWSHTPCIGIDVWNISFWRNVVKIVSRRFCMICIALLGLLGVYWLDWTIQRKQHLVGAGLTRAFLFVLINLHIIIAGFLLFLIVRQAIKLYIEHRDGIPGAVFKRNLLFAFTLFSIIPALFVFFTAGRFITANIDQWFQSRVDTGFASAMHVHQEHTAQLRSKIQAYGQLLVRDLNQRCEGGLAGEERVALCRTIVSHLGVPDYRVYLWLSDGTPVNGAFDDEVKVWRSYRGNNDRPIHGLKQVFLRTVAQLGLEGGTFDFYGSLYWAAASPHYTVIVAKRYPRMVRRALIDAQCALADYQQLKQMRRPILFNYICTFIVITLLIVLLAIWCAFYLARGMAKPIQELMRAMQGLHRGDFSITVYEYPSSELRPLMQGFNQMTQELCRSRKELEAHNQEVVRANKLKTWQEAAQQIAHEIKNPLTPIQLATQRLQRKYSDVLNEDQLFAQSTKTILEQVRIIQDLVNHFNAFASMPKLLFEEVQLFSVINDTLGLYTLSYPDISFSLHADPTLMVITDKKKLTRVLVNILDNSVRVLSEHHVDGGKISIIVSNDAQAGTFNITIIDNGIGIDPLIKDKLFLPYVSSGKKNMGLGLAIVQDIVQQLSGTVNLASRQSGAAFCLTFPIVPPQKFF